MKPPLHSGSLAHRLQQAAGRHPDELALITADQRYSFAALLEAARIRKTVPVDRVKIEAIKGYNKFIGDQVALKPELQDDPAFLEKAMKMYGLSAADLSTPMMQGVTPENDDEFPTT